MKEKFRTGREKEAWERGPFRRGVGDVNPPIGTIKKSIEGRERMTSFKMRERREFGGRELAVNQCKAVNGS